MGQTVVNKIRETDRELQYTGAETSPGTSYRVGKSEMLSTNC